MGKILFVDTDSSGEAGETLGLAGRIAGPSWIVAASELSTADFDGVSVVALGGSLDEGGDADLASSIVPFASEIAARPYAVYSTRCATQERLVAAAKVLAAAIGESAALVLELAASPEAAGSALRSLVDRSAASPLPGPELMARIEAFVAEHKTCALATASPEGVPRATPIEYLWKDGGFNFFSEGGVKFMGLAEGAPLSLCIYDEYASMATVKGLQVLGRAHLILDGSDEWKLSFAARGVDPEPLTLHRHRLNLFRLEPESFELLDVSLRDLGLDSRQVLNPVLQRGYP